MSRCKDRCWAIPHDTNDHIDVPLRVGRWLVKAGLWTIPEQPKKAPRAND